jgi:hypothetical protein
VTAVTAEGTERPEPQAAAERFAGLRAHLKG